MIDFMTLGELMPGLGKFHCTETVGIDGSALYKGKTYPIAIDEERGRVRITVGEIYLFSTIEELKNYGEIE